MPLKDLRPPRMVLAAVVPVFPGRGRVPAGRAAVWGGARGKAGEHARGVWDREREALARRAIAVERDLGGRREWLAGALELEFLGALGRHVAGESGGCGREGCADWLAWGVGQVPGLRQLFAGLGGRWQGVPPGYARALARVVREG